MDIKTSPEKYKEKIHTAENLKDKDIEKLLERSVKIISSLSDKNTATSNFGGAVFQNGKFIMSGTAKIPYGGQPCHAGF